MAQEEKKEQEIGRITHFFSHLNVGIISLQAGLHVGDTIHIKGHTTDFTQTIDSMQQEHLEISEGKAGDDIGIKVEQQVREGDVVYKVAA